MVAALAPASYRLVEPKNVYKKRAPDLGGSLCFGAYAVSGLNLNVLEMPTKIYELRVRLEC